MLLRMLTRSYGFASEFSSPKRKYNYVFLRRKQAGQTSDHLRQRSPTGTNDNRHERRRLHEEDRVVAISLTALRSE